MLIGVIYIVVIYKRYENEICLDYLQQDTWNSILLLSTFSVTKGWLEKHTFNSFIKLGRFKKLELFACPDRWLNNSTSCFLYIDVSLYAYIILYKIFIQ